jgi:catechol 2,3-dioxygenase-like lactoylglutathione lyase family enzyme
MTVTAGVRRRSPAYRQMGGGREMLLAGLNHIAVLTNDTERLCSFYKEVFEATVMGELRGGEDLRLTILEVGPSAELNVFEISGNTEATHQTPIFGRGRIDHFGLHTASKEAFDTIRGRLMACGASDGFVTDFGPILSVFFRDPDGLEGEVCMTNPDAVPGVVNPPGTPAAGYDVSG